MTLEQTLDQIEPGTITTIAGVGYPDGIPAKEADAGWPMGVVRRPDGDLIVCDYLACVLWRIDGDGILHRFAGDFVAGNSGDGGPALEARFLDPHDLTQDKDGNLFLSDLSNDTIRRIDHETGVITRVAGSGRRGRGGDGGLATDAELDCTCGVAIDDAGNLYLSSEWMNNIRRVDAETGIIETVFGQIARHYPSEVGESRPGAGPGLSLGGYHGDGGPASEAGFNHPEHLAFDSKGNLYVCDNSNDRIRKIDMQTSIITTVLGNGQRASNGDGGPAVEASTLMPDSICLDAQDNLYVGEKYGFRVRKVDAETGIVTTLVGNGVPGFGEEGLHGSETRCNSCESGIWADPDGTVYWGDCSGRLRRYDGETGVVTTVLGGTSVHDGEPATSGFLCGPQGLAVGANGHIYVADHWGQRVREIDTDGVIHTIAGNGARAYGGDNGPATEAYLGNPHDVSVDPEGRVVIADTRHNHVRRIEADGNIHSIAGTNFDWDKGDGGLAVGACLLDTAAVAHDDAGNTFIGTGVGRIRRIDVATGIIDTVAGIGLPGYTGDGGPATKAKIGRPTAIALMPDGGFYFADSKSCVIRHVDADGIITTIAGCGEKGFSEDGTPAREARLGAPAAVTAAARGTLYFCDSANHLVRTIDESGNLQTIAGTDGGDSGDGGPATEARLNEPNGLCFYGADLLLISDHKNNKIRAMRLPRG